jgi:hypothetical protein
MFVGLGSRRSSIKVVYWVMVVVTCSINTTDVFEFFNNDNDVLEGNGKFIENISKRI